MKIDKYITELIKLRQAYGPEVEVVKGLDEVVVGKAALPRVAHMHAEKGRSLFREGRDLDKLKGKMVVRV